MSILKLCPNLRRILTAFAVAMTPLFTGGWSWNWLEGHQSTLQTEGPVAEAQAQVFYVTVWVTTIIFVLVASALAYATIKFKAHGKDEENAPPPEQSHGNPLIELSLIGASVLALVVIAVPTLRAIWYDYDVPAAEKANSYEITATGYQWWFRFEYPKENINGGGHLLTANEMVIPVGRAVNVNLRTVDVIHSFWVPKLAGKVDMIPNRGNHLWLQADHAGYYWGQCAEFCGEDHAVMRFRVIALDAKDFAAWVEHQKETARTVKAVAGAAETPKAQFASYSTAPVTRNTPGYTEAFDADPFGGWKKNLQPDEGEDPALIAKGRQIFQQKTCVGCHTVRGQEGAGNVAPDLTHVGARSTIAGGVLENNPANLYRWVTNPDNVKPGNKMYYGTGGMTGYMKRDGDNWVPNITVNDAEAHALVAYLRSLK
jgi:cytochrome c oxidase subunit 2